VIVIPSSHSNIEETILIKRQEEVSVIVIPSSHSNKANASTIQFPLVSVIVIPSSHSNLKKDVTTG